MIPERAEAAGGGGGEGGEGGGGGTKSTQAVRPLGWFFFVCVVVGFFLFVLPVRCSLLSGVLLAPRGGKK